MRSPIHKEAPVYDRGRHPSSAYAAAMAKHAFVPARELNQFAKEFHVYDLARLARKMTGRRRGGGLRIWANDLRYHFPFLDGRTVKHPYALFCYLWKLSWILGRKYADASISYEALVRDAASELRRLYALLAIENCDFDALAKLVSGSSTGRWTSYASDAWFRAIEEDCEAVLEGFLRVCSA